MKRTTPWLVIAVLSAAAMGAIPGRPVFASGAEAADEGRRPRVLAFESFLADIAQNVAGSRLKVACLIPVGADPHGFEPSPSDVRKVSDSDVIVLNGGGYEAFLGALMKNTGGPRPIIEASAGLNGRRAREGEIAEAHEGKEGGERGAVDPHFWLSPINAVKYAENIRDGLSRADPEGAPVYAANARAYIASIEDLDRRIAARTEAIPIERRLLLTNHDSLGYFADRYGFRIVGTVIPSFSTEESPSARQLASLIDKIRKTGGRALFLETGANPHLAEQIAKETGIRLVTGLYTDSLSEPGGAAPTYIDMMEYDTGAIVDALK